MPPVSLRSLAPHHHPRTSSKVATDRRRSSSISRSPKQLASSHGDEACAGAAGGARCLGGGPAAAVRRRAAGRRRGDGVRRHAADPVRGRHHRQLAAQRGVLQQAQGAAAVPVHVRARPQAAALRQLAQRQECHGHVQGAHAVVLTSFLLLAPPPRT